MRLCECVFVCMSVCACASLWVCVCACVSVCECVCISPKVPPVWASCVFLMRADWMKVRAGTGAGSGVMRGCHGVRPPSIEPSHEGNVCLSVSALKQKRSILLFFLCRGMRYVMCVRLDPQMCPNCCRFQIKKGPRIRSTHTPTRS